MSPNGNVPIDSDDVYNMLGKDYQIIDMVFPFVLPLVENVAAFKEYGELTKVNIANSKPVFGGYGSFWNGWYWSNKRRTCLAMF